MTFFTKMETKLLLPKVSLLDRFSQNSTLDRSILMLISSGNVFLLNKKWCRLLVGFGGIFLFMVLSCTPPPQPRVTILELSTCKGWDYDKNPIDASSTFLTTDDRIVACGRLQTNVPVTIVVNWYHEDKYLFREVISEVEDYFSSTYHAPGEFFLAGNYKIQIVIGKTVAMTTTFQIQEP